MRPLFPGYLTPSGKEQPLPEPEAPHRLAGSPIGYPCRTGYYADGWEEIYRGTMVGIYQPGHARIEEEWPRALRSERGTRIVIGKTNYEQVIWRLLSPVRHFTVQDLLRLAWSSTRQPVAMTRTHANYKPHAEAWGAEVLRLSALSDEELEAEAALFVLRCAGG